VKAIAEEGELQGRTVTEEGFACHGEKRRTFTQGTDRRRRKNLLRTKNQNKKQTGYRLVWRAYR
jgi:hypothetical protein